MFEQAFRNIDDILRKEAGCTTELDYTEQTSWLLFLKYVDGLEEDRATASAKAHIDSSFNAKQRLFLDFVLQHYVNVGVEELDQDKLTPLLRLKYHDSLADAVADLGAPEQIGAVFAGFQKFLYEPQPLA